MNKKLVDSSRTSSPSSTSRARIKGKLVGGFRNLILWQEAKKLTIMVYKLTKNFPKNEEFGLTIQMRKSAVSIMSQVAEGWIRRSTKDKLRFLEIAEGSLLELENQGEVSRAVGYWTEEKYQKFDKQRARVSYLLFRYKNKIE